MKMFRYIIILMLITSLISCIDDKGNYTYQDLEDVLPEEIITGIEKSYSISSQEYLKITPKLIDLNEDDYEYCWYLYGIGYTSKSRDTIAKTKDLNLHITLNSGIYRMWFKATSKTTGVSFFKSTDVTVESIYNNGWFVLKKENNSSDLDFIDSKGNLHSNIISSINNKSIEGNPLNLSYIKGQYTHNQEEEDGTITKLTRQNVIFLLTDQDIAVINTDNMEIFKHYDELFYIKPESKKRPQNVISNITGQILINDGKVHWIESNYENIGKFSSAMLGDYSLSSYGMSYFYGGMLVHDNLNKVFKVAIPWTSTITNISSSKINYPFDIIYMKEQQTDPDLIMTQNGLAIIKEISSGTLKGVILNTAWTYGQDPVDEVKDIPVESKLYNSNIIAVNNNNFVVYFSEGDNKLYMYNIISDNQNINSPVLQYPENEKIKFINHVSYVSYNESSTSFDNLSVITATATGWKLYLYEFVGTTSEIVTPEKLTYTGTGEPAHVMHIGSSSSIIN